MADLNGVPGDVEVWRIDGRANLVYTVPGSNPPIPMLWYVSDPADLQAMFGPGVPITFDRELTQADADAAGAIDFGVSTELANTSEHPFETFLHTFEQEAEIRPWLRDPEILAVTAQAILEGRAVTDAELKTTDWWQSRTDAERSRIATGAADPATYAADLEDWKVQVRDTFVKAGYPSPPESLVTYYAQQVNQGAISEVGLADAIRRETDPYAPGASPFAGQQLPDGATAVRRGDETFIRTADGDYRLTGPGQVARFGQDAAQTAVAGDYFTDGTRHALRTPDGLWHAASGDGQIAFLQRMYGEPNVVPPEHIGDTAGRSVLSLHGGVAGSLEGFADPIREVGTAGQLFGGLPDDEGVSALGGEEEVRRLLHTWLGPMFAAGYSQEWIAEWAGKIRNGGPGVVDQLIDHLRQTGKSLFPDYDPNLTYEAKAAPWRGLYASYAGVMPNEATDELFHRIVNTNDAAVAGQLLRTEGLERAWAPVMDNARQGIRSEVGDNVIGSPV